MWQIIIIVIVVAMMVGPIFMMRPSGRDEREAKLRNIAREMGLIVHLSARPSEKTQSSDRQRENSGQQFAVYMLPWPESILSREHKMPSWTLEQKKYQHDIHFQGFWDWLNACKSPESWFQAIHATLSTLPVGVVALSSASPGLSVYWDESLRGKTPELAVGNIYETLSTLMRSVSR